MDELVGRLNGAAETLRRKRARPYGTPGHFVFGEHDSSEA